MPPSLRKACHACTAAKRRCIPRLPNCPRCAERGLLCQYDLEPVNSDPRHREKLAVPRVFDSIEAAHLHAISTYKASGEFVNGIPLMGNEETFAIAIGHLAQIPALTFQSRSSLFVHKNVFSLAILPTLESSATTSLSTKQLLMEQDRLLSLDVHELSFVEFLGNLHRLIAIILSYALKPNVEIDRRTLSPDFQSVLDLLHQWSVHFQTTLPEDLGSDFPAWTAWATAETTRRTMIAVVVVSGIVQVLQTGVCSYQPFVEALCFDSRTGVWEAESEEAWQRAVDHHGNGVGEASLVSWSEFIECGGAAPRQQHDGMLQRFLLACYFGKETQLPSEMQTSIPFNTHWLANPG
ncbi:hypothetical protein B0A52_00712 [Exophiala mesophila]|uniref:Zn(2)-C6 fungal-type domain-containing protein n=1 Tax=Exophiala mesophila TaxID=212818 RepID=A0A438NHZ9_EXOME|nr:hypothetical protein B0A52_00712 [Exophiala mesophila]